MTKVLNLQVIPWTWRDGSVHLEMRLATFPDTFSGITTTHLEAGGTNRFHSACGEPFFGRLSSTGLGDTRRVDCPRCRAILRSATFNCTMESVSV